MASLFLIFNHTFTDNQRSDALASLDVRRIVDMPSDYKKIWRNISPDLPAIEAYLEPVKLWLKLNAKPDDFALIQGDFGACYIMVNFAFDQGFIPVYSTTERVAVEEHGGDGTIQLIHQFKHQIFRRYGV